MNKVFLLFAGITVFIYSCNKDNPSTTNNPNQPVKDSIAPSNPPSTIDSAVSPTVYVAGDSFDLSTRNVPFPVYWKNGRQIHLPHAGYSSGSGLAVSDNNVYVSSSGQFSGNNVTYWKNATGINLIDPSIITPTATAITLSGTDVYTVGGAYINNYEKFVPIYWKNQEKAIKIATFSSSSGTATDIAVAGADVYIAGTTPDPLTGNGSSPPCYWKNGSPTFLHSISPSSERGTANSICPSGSDVHVVGEVYPIGSASKVGWAVYWKNGVATELTPPTQVSYAQCVIVVGNDVYIAGAIAGSDGLPRATYWKNGVATQLESIYSMANSITVYENDVYIAGDRGQDTALYWKNGKSVILGRGRANAIVVKK